MERGRSDGGRRIGEETTRRDSPEIRTSGTRKLTHDQRNGRDGTALQVSLYRHP